MAGSIEVGALDVVSSNGLQTNVVTTDNLGNLLVNGIRVAYDLDINNPGVTGTNVYGLIYNKTNDSYKRFGTGTVEDNVWISTFGSRLNDNSNQDPITTFFNKTTTVQGNMKRVVVNNAGAYVKDYNATDYAHPDQTELTLTQSVMVQIPKFYYISIKFVYNNDTYNLFAQSLNPFSIDLSTMGFSGASSIAGQNVTGYASYGSISGTVVTSVVHNAFNYYDGSVKDTLYIGAFESSNSGSNYRSSCTASLTSTPIKAVATQTIATFRTQHKNFGANFATQNWFEREALVLTLLIERGTFQTETNGANNYSKWEAYSWNSSGSSDDQNLGLTLVLGNTTGVIKNASNQTIACNYRGVENPYGHLWEFVDGCNVISGAVWLAKHGATYASNTTASPYFTSGRTTLTSGTGVYISDIFDGTFIPSAATGASNVTKMTDGAWFATGNTILYVGGDLTYPGSAGSVAWASSDASSLSSWASGSRFAVLS